MPYCAISASEEQYDNLSVISSFSQSSLGLQATLDPLENLEGFLNEVAPYLEGCELFSSNREVKESTSHNLLSIRCGGVSFFNSYIKVNKRQDGSLMISSKLPKNIEIEKVENEINNCEGELKYLEQDDKYKALSLVVNRENYDFKDPKTCKTIISKARFIHVEAEVHLENSTSGLSFRELNYINDSGYLDNEKLAVFGNYRASERAYAEDLVFNYSSNPYIQDQVQTFFNIDNALTKLEGIFGYQLLSLIHI